MKRPGDGRIRDDPTGAFAASQDPTPIRREAGFTACFTTVAALVTVRATPARLGAPEAQPADDDAGVAPSPEPIDPGLDSDGDGIARIVRATLRIEEDDVAWLVTVGTATHSALQQLSMQARSLGQTLTPNTAILRFAGSANLTVDQVSRKRSELLTMFGLNVISVRPEPGVVAVSIARPKRRLITIEQVWKRWAPQATSAVNQELVIGLKEEDNSLLTFSPGNLHAPHTLIAGSTGSGKSVPVAVDPLGLSRHELTRAGADHLYRPQAGC